MSRAFVKESDREDELPEIPLSEHPNHVTPRGLALLRARLDAALAERADLREDDGDVAAAARRRSLEREIRWLEARVAGAHVVDPARQPRDRVAFGATVDVADADGVEATYRIVGEDEAAAERGDVSWVSPLAQALLGARVGDEVLWRRPRGDLRIEVLAIRYDD
jgi:transcription elongation GreA/GreB family factor